MGEAGATLALDFTGGVPALAGTSPFGGLTVGWEFQVVSPIMVHDLGFWDEGRTVLTNTHDVGLWTGDGSTLLASTTITNASIPVASVSANGQWLFNPVPAVLLNPGDYVIGAHYLNLDADAARLNVLSADLFALPQIAFVTERGVVGPALGFPNGIETVDNIGPFGPNLAVSSVPEPSSLWLLGIGIAGIGARGWIPRKRAAKQSTHSYRGLRTEAGIGINIHRSLRNWLNSNKGTQSLIEFFLTGGF